MGPHRYPRGLDVALDAAILLVGVALLGASVFNWFSDGHPIDVID